MDSPVQDNIPPLNIKHQNAANKLSTRSSKCRTPTIQHCCWLHRGRPLWLVFHSMHPARSIRAARCSRQNSGRVVPVSETPTSPPDQLSSYLALGPCTASRASQTGSAMAWSTVPGLITPRSFGTACCMPLWMLMHLCWMAALFMSRLTGSLLALGTDGLNTTGWPKATELGGFSLCLFIHIWSLALLVLPTCKPCYCNM